MFREEIFVRNKPELEGYLRFVREAFQLQNRLPDQVFRENFTEFWVSTEFPYTLSGPFWEDMQNSVLNTGEQQITVVSLDPDPDACLQWGGRYNAFKMSINASDDDYWQVLNIQPNEMLFSNIVVHVPESLEWAIWSSSDLELCILGFNKAKNGDAILAKPGWAKYRDLVGWMSIEEAIVDIMPRMYRDDIVPVDIASKLRQNYGTSS